MNLITKQTAIPLGLAGAVTMAIVVGLISILGSLNSFENDQLLLLDHDVHQTAQLTDIAKDVRELRTFMATHSGEHALIPPDIGVAVIPPDINVTVGVIPPDIDVAVIPPDTTVVAR